MSHSAERVLPVFNALNDGGPAAGYVSVGDELFEVVPPPSAFSPQSMKQVDGVDKTRNLPVYVVKVVRGSAGSGFECLGTRYTRNMAQLTSHKKGEWVRIA
jgi:hypothetical protein